jgi:hypothetical protein
MTPRTVVKWRQQADLPLPNHERVLGIVGAMVAAGVVAALNLREHSRPPRLRPPMLRDRLPRRFLRTCRGPRITFANLHTIRHRLYTNETHRAIRSYPL